MAIVTKGCDDSHPRAEVGKSRTFVQCLCGSAVVWPLYRDSPTPTYLGFSVVSVLICFGKFVALDPNAGVVPREQRTVENGLQRAAFVRENSEVIIVIANRENFHAVGILRNFCSQKERDMIGITRKTDVGVSFSIHLFLRS